MKPGSLIGRAALALLFIGLLTHPAAAEEEFFGWWPTDGACPAEATASQTTPAAQVSPVDRLHVATGYWFPIRPFLEELGYPKLQQLLNPPAKTKQNVRRGKVKLVPPWQMSYAADGWQPAPRPAQHPDTPADVETDDLTPAEREILAIREKVGSLLDGTTFQQTITPEDEHQLLTVLRALQHERPLPQWRPARNHLPQPTAWQAEAPDEQSRQHTLRASAEQLDQAANDLERQELYARADQLRDLARQLRLDARGVIPAKNCPVPAQQEHREPSRLIPEPATPLGRRQTAPGNPRQAATPQPHPTAPDINMERVVEGWTGFRRLRRDEVQSLRNDLRKLQHLLEPSATTAAGAYIEALAHLGMKDLAEDFRKSGAPYLDSDEIEWMHSQLLRTQLRLVKDRLDSIETIKR